MALWESCSDNPTRWFGEVVSKIDLVLCRIQILFGEVVFKIDLVLCRIQRSVGEALFKNQD